VVVDPDGQAKGVPDAGAARVYGCHPVGLGSDRPESPTRGVSVSQPTGIPDAPHLVMLSGSHAQHDARVRKSAATAAAAGYRVTVVAPSPTGVRFDQDEAGWRLLNVPVGRHARERATRARTVGLLGYRDEEAAQAARERPALGRRGQLRRAVVRLRTLVMRYRQTRRIYASRWTQPAVRLLLRIPALSRWQRLVPESLDLDAAFGQLVDDLRPDLLQSHDVQTINVVAGAAGRAAAQGRRVPWIYDAHEHIAGLTSYPPDRLTGLVNLEASFIRQADGVLTVCEPLAEYLLTHYHLPARPTVVLNAPLGAPSDDHGHSGGATHPARSLRSDVGLGPDVPIVVYSGKVDAARGIGDLVAAFPHLSQDVHVVLITNRSVGDSYLSRLSAQLRQNGGAAERLHTVPYVLPDDLVDYLSGATVGFAGFSHIGNHEVSLPNKFFDYLHAGLPMVVSDLQLLGPLVRELGVGQVYTFGDPEGLATAIETLIARRGQYLAALHDPQLRRRYSWQAQEPALIALYGRVLAAASATAGQPVTALRRP
jgi:glycosyltransferase involved in cell wall biosynthesis